jgi:5'-nucleotidase/UDP-sugar diphosphatase
MEKMNFTLNNEKIENLKLKRYEIKKNEVAPDGKIANIIDNYKRRVDKIISKVIGQSSMDFKIDNFNEMELGDLVADWLREASGAELCLINSNSMRVGLPSGNITREDLYRAFPFDNFWVLLKMNGKQIFDTVEKCYLTKRPIFQVSGCSMVIDRNSKNPIVSFLINGRKIDESRDYMVVTNSFLAQGGDGYIEFFNSKRLKEGMDIRRLVEENIKKYSLIGAKIQDRIVMITKGDNSK